SDDAFLQNSPDDLIETIFQDAYLQPLELHTDKGISHPPREIKRTIFGLSRTPIDGFIYSIEVPYTGASGLFNHQPETFDLDKPTAQLNSQNMRSSIVVNRAATADVSQQRLFESFDSELDKVRKYIAFQAFQIDPFNASLKDEAARIVYGRRDRLLKARQIA